MKKIDPAAEEFLKQQIEEWWRKFKEEDEEEKAKYPDEDWSDTLAVEAREYREYWESCWTGVFGTFDTITPIQPMRYTDKPAGHASNHYTTLQIFSVKIRETRGDLQWPLHVFGLVAARDTIDHNRNMIFNRPRENCQTLTQEDPYLLLTGPTRAVVVCDPVYFEVVLKVKGSNESEDKAFSFLGEKLTNTEEVLKTCLVNRDYISKLSTLELSFGFVVRSVEATIKLQVTDGSWPDGFQGRVTAHTSSLENNEVVLLDSGDEKMPIDADGMIKLSRRVASVECDGELKVSVVAFGCDDDNKKIVGGDEKAFTAKVVEEALIVLMLVFVKWKSPCPGHSFPWLLSDYSFLVQWCVVSLNRINPTKVLTST